MYLVRFVSAAVAAAVLAFPGVAGAVSFGGTYGVSANGADPGLVVQVAPGAGVFGTPDLAVGGSHVFDVFRIWTDESSVNAGEDDVAKPISASFTSCGSSFMNVPARYSSAANERLSNPISVSIFSAGSRCSRLTSTAPSITAACARLDPRNDRWVAS